MKKSDHHMLPAETLRAEIKKTEKDIAVTHTRLANQERRLVDLKMALLDRLESA